MKKISLLLLLSFSIAGSKLYAQYNTMNLYDQHFNFFGGDLLPSKLGDDYSSIQVKILPSLYGYAGNSFMGIDNILYPSTEKINDAIDNVGDFALIGAGAEIPSLSFGYKVKKDGDELMSLALKTNTRLFSNLLIGGNFLGLLWRGNKQFEGQEVSLGKFGASAYHVSQVSLGWAMPLQLSDENFDLRVGANLKYLFSAGAFHMDEVSPTLSTGEDGRSISISNLSGTFQYASPAENGNTFPGKGFGIDLGATVKHKDSYVASISVLDIGKLNYKGNTESQTFSGSFSFDGVYIEDIFSESPELELDSIFNFETTEDSGQTFSLSLPTRLVVQLEKNIGSSTKKKGRRFIQHGVYLTYIQGFNNVAGTTTRPFFSAGYSYSLNYNLNVGPVLNYGGYGKFGMGAFASVRAGSYRVGIGTNSGLSYLLSPNTTGGVDVSFMALYAFGNTGKAKQVKPKKNKTKSAKESAGKGAKEADVDAEYEENKEKVGNKIAD